MAQQNVPPAFTEYEKNDKIPAIYRAFKSLACKDSPYEDLWQDMLNEFDYEKILKCYKFFFDTLLFLVKTRTDDDQEVEEDIRQFFVKIALLSISK